LFDGPSGIGTESNDLRPDTALLNPGQGISEAFQKFNEIKSRKTLTQLRPLFTGLSKAQAGTKAGQPC